MAQSIAAIRKFLKDDDAATAVEYAVMLALIMMAAITIVKSLGTTTSGTFSKVNSGMGS